MLTDSALTAQVLGHANAVGKYAYTVTIASGFFGETFPHVIADTKRDAERLVREYALRSKGIEKVGRVIVYDRVKR